jgi:MFS family permease
MARQKKRINVRESLQASFKDGIFASVMVAIMDYYITPFALFLNATPQQIGWASAVPNLVGSIGQLFAVRLIHWTGGRLKFLLRVVFSQATFLLSLSFLAYFQFEYQIYVFIALLVLTNLCGGLAGPAWGSLVSDYIPMHKRGQYFGWRNRMLGIVNVISVIFGGLLLYGSRTISTAWGFLALFLTAACARFASGAYIARMIEPPTKRDPASDFTFFMFVSRFRESNFVKFVAFIASLTFSAYLAGPFFAVFMLRDLKLSYLTYMVLQVASSVAALAALPLWGRHADLVGNVRVLRLSGFLVTLIPLFWLVSHNFFYLALVQTFAGFAWSGVTLCASNFIYDAVTPQKRARCISYFNVINGCALFSGASAGGFLATRMQPIFGFPLLSLFALSALCRLFFFLVFFRRFHEVRPSREVSLQELFFSVVGIRPLIGTVRH